MGRKVRRSLAAVAVLVVLSLGVGAAPMPNGIVSEPKQLALETQENFPIDASLRARVQFWIDIYAKYSSWQSVVHDKLYPQIVYGVAESTNPEKRPAVSRTNFIQSRAQEVLHKLHKNRQAIERGTFKLNEEEKRIYDLFQSIPGDDKFLAAADPERFRRQGGLRDQLLTALHLSGRYLPRMQKLFEGEGLPPDIAYLPFVESSFNKEAVSKVGASGIWQIMPNTGREFLRVDEVVDERNDPMRAAGAAAKLMRQNFEALKAWPLAITAYNHGKIGMERAVRAMGTRDLSAIIAGYNGPSFGFASANFYASFLAAKHVAQNYEHYLGRVERARILEFDEFVMPDFVAVSDLIKYINVPLQDLRELNPALLEGVWSGKYYIPLGYVLRVPLAVRDSFLSSYEEIPDTAKHAQQRAVLVTGASLQAASDQIK